MPGGGFYNIILPRLAGDGFTCMVRPMIKPPILTPLEILFLDVMALFGSVIALSISGMSDVPW